MARYVRRVCGYCDGKGKVADATPVPTWRTCVACDGFRFVFVPGDHIKCPDCGGTGRHHPGVRYQKPTRCKRCRGTGWTEPVLVHP
jgi:DnaJ-class molecular chaperone